MTPNQRAWTMKELRDRVDELELALVDLRGAAETNFVRTDDLYLKASIERANRALDCRSFEEVADSVSEDKPGGSADKPGGSGPRCGACGRDFPEGAGAAYCRCDGTFMTDAPECTHPPTDCVKHQTGAYRPVTRDGFRVGGHVIVKENGKKGRIVVIHQERLGSFDCVVDVEIPGGKAVLGFGFEELERDPQRITSHWPDWKKAGVNYEQPGVPRTSEAHTPECGALIGPEGETCGVPRRFCREHPRPNEACPTCGRHG